MQNEHSNRNDKMTRFFFFRFSNGACVNVLVHMKLSPRSVILWIEQRDKPLKGLHWIR